MTSNLMRYTISELNEFIGRKIEPEYVSIEKYPKIDMFDENKYLCIRIIPPGYGVTADYIQNRLNIDIDENYIITQIYYG
jgi:hypothetical protein